VAARKTTIVIKKDKRNPNKTEHFVFYVKRLGTETNKAREEEGERKCQNKTQGGSTRTKEHCSKGGGDRKPGD
jgi:hypothetical protein